MKAASQSRGAAAFIDGTAVYFRSREGRASDRLDYEALNRVLLSEAQANTFDPALFFTTYDAQNEGQAKFLQFIQSRLGWVAETRPVWDADPIPERARWDRSERNEFIRFDASITYALGRLVDQRSTIVIVTDSFALEHAMTSAAGRGQARIVLAFFGRQLDSRWLPILKDGHTKIHFMDLDAHSEALFGREIVPTAKSNAGLARL